jgi:hypothetical protein
MIIDASLLLLQIVCGLFLADFASGFMHWAVDVYGNPRWRVIGPRHIAHSHNHHTDALELLRLPFAARHGGIMVFSALIAALIAALGWFHPVLISALVFGALTNIIHGWSHQSAERNGMFISALHRAGLFQSPRHHVHHHGGANDTHYCLLTDHVNPILEKIALWRRLEGLCTALGLKAYAWREA